MGLGPVAQPASTAQSVNSAVKRQAPKIAGIRPVIVIPRPITMTGRMPAIFGAWRFTALFTLCAVLAGCATGPNPRDPYESSNRQVFKFNEAVDNAVTKPIAKGYKAITPDPVRSGVTNFFGNFLDVQTALNELFQAKVSRSANSTGRVLINSTIGFFGV